MANTLEEKLAENAAHYLAEQPDVLLAYLFGSHGRGEATPLSDIDIGVLLPDMTTPPQRFERRLAIGLDLQRILRHNDLDIVVLNDASLALAYRVLRDGQLLCCQDEDVRVLYTAATVSRYLDFKPFIERHHQAILNRARRGELFDGPNPYRRALERYRQGRARFADRPGSSA